MNFILFLLSFDCFNFTTKIALFVKYLPVGIFTLVHKLFRQAHRMDEGQHACSEDGCKYYLLDGESIGSVTMDGLWVLLVV